MIDLAEHDQLKRILQKHGMWAKKELGQHFLVDQVALNSIVFSAELASTDNVIEVGPGPGVLSQRIAPLVHHLLCVEIDDQVIPVWAEVMSEFTNVDILHQDVLQFQPTQKHYKVVANIPYYITSPILKHFLRNAAFSRPRMIVLLIQKEVAQRICSEKQPTLLSWEIRLFGEADLVSVVPGSSFMPPPKVDSAVLRIRLFDKPLIPESHIDPMIRLMSLAYSQPRKTLMNNLLSSQVLSKDELAGLFQQAGFNEKIRPHELKIEDWIVLLGLFSALKGS